MANSPGVEERPDGRGVTAERVPTAARPSRGAHVGESHVPDVHQRDHTVDPEGQGTLHGADQEPARAHAGVERTEAAAGDHGRHPEPAGHPSLDLALHLPFDGAIDAVRRAILGDARLVDGAPIGRRREGAGRRRVDEVRHPFFQR